MSATDQTIHGVRQVALITGSTSGIGLACAHALARQGLDILINGFGEEKLIKRLLSEIQR
jgi:3-hydroxybutyrate dehydrogenase